MSGADESWVCPFCQTINQKESYCINCGAARKAIPVAPPKPSTPEPQPAERPAGLGRTIAKGLLGLVGIGGGPEEQPVIDVDLAKVQEHLKRRWGSGFKRINAQIIWALSRGNYTMPEIARFLDTNRDTATDEWNFMVDKGVFDSLPKREKAPAWATAFIREAMAPSSTEVRGPRDATQ